MNTAKKYRLIALSCALPQSAGTWEQVGITVVVFFFPQRKQLGGLPILMRVVSHPLGVRGERCATMAMWYGRQAFGFIIFQCNPVSVARS